MFHLFCFVFFLFCHQYIVKHIFLAVMRQENLNLRKEGEAEEAVTTANFHRMRHLSIKQTHSKTSFVLAELSKIATKTG